MINNNNIECPIGILEKLVADIEGEQWVNEEAQKLVRNGVILAVGRLEKHGFMRLTDVELDVTPLTKVDPSQLELPIKS